MTIKNVDSSKYRSQFERYLQDVGSVFKDYKDITPKIDENFTFSCYEEILKVYGQFSEPIEDESYPLKRRQRDLQSRWLIALKLANEDFIYTEGLVLLPESEVPYESAWLTDSKTGKAVDPIWHGTGLAYFGVAFNKDFVIQHSSEAGAVGIFQTDMETSAPILEAGLPNGCLWKKEK